MDSVWPRTRGANAVLNCIAERGSNAGEDWVSIEWDAWDNAGEAQALALKAAAITPPEGQDAFLHILGAPRRARVIVAVHDLDERVEAWVRLAKTPQAADSGSHGRPDLSTAFVAPRSDTERKLADIWSTQLGLDEVGVHDRFFDLGGHSLLAIQVAAEIRNTFSVEMPVVQFFKAPTIADLAVLIENPSDASRRASPVAPDGRRG